MYLKSLTLKGFKSFADKTRMVFDPGLTVVVGPNGSGKSNISDAILWVLGEQSAKHLRGSAMEDVIFAGSSGRAAVSVAEVDLVLDNADHTLPIDFEEVAITRRMYRSGESEYLVNASPARLMDVQDILHDSGLGRQTHSIISQGKLDAVLMSRPEERRALIEEAAGISKHKRRRERSLRRLASMDEYLKRAQDLERTLVRQIRPLERQVERAQRYEAAVARRDELAVMLAVDDLRRLRERWNQVLAAEGGAGEALDRAQARLAERQAELDRLQGLLDAKGLFAGDVSERRRRCAALAERLGASTSLLEEKGRHMVARLSELYDGIGRAEAQARSLDEALAQARGQQDEARGELEGLEDALAEADEGLRAAKSARREAETLSSRLAARGRDLACARDEASLAVAKADDALANAREADEMYATRLAQLDEADARTSEALAAGRAETARLAEGLEIARREHEACQARKDVARQAQQEAGHALTRAQDDLRARQAELDAARQALSSLDAESAGLARLVEGMQDKDPLAARLAVSDAVRAHVAGRVAEALDIPQELTGLVERVLGSAASGFVVRDGQALLAVTQIAETTADAHGCASFVSCDAGDAASDAGEDALPGYPLTSRVADVAGLPGVARALLGDVRVVDGARVALEASARDEAHAYVTPEGVCARAGRVVTLGEPQGSAGGVLAASARMRALAFDRPALEEALRRAQEGSARAQEALDGARDARDASAHEYATCDGALSAAEGALARARAEVGRAAQALERMEQGRARDALERKDVERRRKAAADRAREAGAASKQASARLDEAMRAIEALEAQVREAQAGADAARRADREAHERVSACRERLASKRERAHFTQSRVAELERDLASAREAARVARETARATDVMSGRIEPLHARLRALAESARAWESRLAERAELAQADAASLKEALAAARTDVASAQQGYTDALNALNDVKVRKGQLDVQVNNAVNAITSRPGVVLEEALALPAPEDRGAAEAEVARLERELAGIGPVNHVAMEEFERLSSQASYVSRQVEDLRGARASLTKIIAAIDRKMRASFLETFEAVNANFQEIFATLFPGGTGRLEMTDPDDPDETGIEVVAQPLGKRVTKMTLLSGGERSLAALGLLFAVYKTRTVPFYVLDEVEAALDDSNLDRLLSAVDMLRRQTQLIVISHQRRTMERADVLYGVSMQADGVSKVVSQRLGVGPAAARGAAAR